MSEPYAFRLVPLADLRAHEEIDAGDVPELARTIRALGEFDNPIWVADGSWVILNGHHRVAAMRRLGAERIPAWVFDYTSDVIVLERWSAGPPISKAEVESRGRDGRLFPPKTTKHVLRVALPERRTRLVDLMPAAPAPPVHRAAGEPARSG